MLIKEKQQGFVLVSVLLITTISTMFAFNAIGENRLQERIGGNQIKEVNARSAAEEGLFKSYTHIQNSNDSIADIIASLATQSQAGVYQITAIQGGKANTIMVTSTGLYNGALASLKAEMIVGEEPSNKYSQGGIVACEGINMIQAGGFDSFDSRNGAYDVSSASYNAEVSVLDGDFIFSGGVEMKGNVTVNGNIDQPSSSGSKVFGDVSATGSLNLNQTSIVGNLTVGGDAIIRGGQFGDGNFGDYVAEKGDVNIGGDATLMANNNTAYGGFNYGGEFVNGNNYDYTENQFNNGQTPNTGTLRAPTALTNECNQLDIANALPSVAADSEQLKTNLSRPYNGSALTLDFSETAATVFNDDSGLGYIEDPNLYSTITPTEHSSKLLGDNKKMYVFDELDLKGTMISIEGDITIMVKGDINIQDHSGFELADDNSSLTILAQGAVNIGSNAEVFSDAKKNAQGESPLTIYSSFDSAENEGQKALSLSGNTDMYAELYAPLGDIEYKAAGDMMGSLEGRNIEFSGSGKIHTDEAIGDSGNTESTTGQDGVGFASIYYNYLN